MSSKRNTSAFFAVLLLMPAMAFASPPVDEQHSQAGSVAGEPAGPQQASVPQFALETRADRSQPVQPVGLGMRIRDVEWDVQDLPSRDGRADSNATPGQKPAGPVPTPEHTGTRAMLKSLVGDFKNLPSKQNLFIAAVGGGLALGVHPADPSVNEELTDASWSHSVFRFGAVLGQSPTLLGASLAVYTVGRLDHQPKVSHIGMDMFRSIAVSEALVQTLKYSVGRERPDGSDARSFPSGHAADTFAVATALERHFGWRGAIPAYAFASYVASSRLPDNVHYLSDVVFGAAVGTIAGRTVTRHGRSNFAFVPVATPGGAALLMVRTTAP